MSSSLLGVAIGSNSTSDGMVVRGLVRINTISDSEQVGQRVYVGEVDGDITATAPSDSGDIVRIVGYAIGHADTFIYFNPGTTWIKVTA